MRTEIYSAAVRSDAEQYAVTMPPGQVGGHGVEAVHPLGANGARATRVLIFGYVGCVLVSRLADANPHPQHWYLVLVAGCFVLPVWYASGLARDLWLRYPWLLLTAQAALSASGFVLFQQHWMGGVSGLLGGLILLVAPKPAAWWMFGGLAAAELGAWALVGFPYQPSPNSAGWVLIAYGNISLGYFGLNRFAELVERLETTQEVLADAAVAQQRLTTAAGVRATILRRVDELSAHARRALDGDSSGERVRHLRLAGEEAREAAGAARRIVTAIPRTSAVGHGVDPVSVTPGLARGIVIAVVVMFGAQYLLNLVFSLPGGAVTNTTIAVMAGGIAITMVVLQLHHSRFQRGGSRPQGWQWTLTAQIVLCLAAYPIFGVGSVVLVAFLGASVLLLVERPIRWVLYGVTLAVLPVAAIMKPANTTTLGFQLQWALYAAATCGGAALLIYGLSRLNRTAVQLDIARHELAAVALTRERLRVTRDTHDTLGLTLATIALKTDLASSLLVRGDPRANREIEQLLQLAASVAADADHIVNGTLALGLESEIAAAEDVLSAAGVAAHVTVQHMPPQGRASSELAAVLREAVTNVLRHSTASECFVTVETQADGIVLSVDNDGCKPAPDAPRGRGLRNIGERIERLGGAVTTNATTERFSLQVRVPILAVEAEPSA
jgi:signal transduction histidine kinase